MSDWYLQREEKRIEAAKAEGKAAVYREIVEWDRRRKEAAARGEEFSEPPPVFNKMGLKQGDKSNWNWNLS